MFMNSNSLPVALMQSLISTVHRDLAWDSEDSKEKVRHRWSSKSQRLMTVASAGAWPCAVVLGRLLDIVGPLVLRER